MSQSALADAAPAQADAGRMGMSKLRPLVVAARPCLALAALVWASLLALQPVAAQAFEREPSEQPEGKLWAVLIGCEKYHRAVPLRYTINDVQQLAQTLRTRAGVPDSQILQMTDQEPNPRLQPLRSNWLAELPTWLAGPGPHDRVIVYFSGHGFRDSQGRLYLAPLDCDPANPAATAVSVESLRKQLADCPAAFKLLVVDSCFAGSEKDGEGVGVTAKELAEPFRGLEGVITLASSTEQQKSQLWEQKQHSLFSYWLIQGLKGHADADGDGSIDIDELYAYVSRQVAGTAAAKFPLPQTPVRVVRSQTVGVPVVLRLRPQSLKQVLGEMAEQLAEGLDEQRLGKVGVLEFTNDTPVGELLGADFGVLGRWCADELERQLIDRAAARYSVVDRKRLQGALKAQQFSVEDLGSQEALQRLAAQADALPALAIGMLGSRAGRVVHLRAKLVRIDRDEVSTSVGGTAWLNESEWAMLGLSAAVPLADRPPPGPGETSEGEDLRDNSLALLDEAARGPNPLADPKWPYRLRLMVSRMGRDGQPLRRHDGSLLVEERKGRFYKNDYVVPLRKGEIYEIWVENRSDHVVLMRLLVDGLNTLPQRSVDKGVQIWEVAPRVTLDEAKFWVLDPRNQREYAVRGFFEAVGARAPRARFLVADDLESLAARRRFTDQLGLITAAFYMPVGQSRLGTAAGERGSEDVAVVSGYEPGELLGVVHIRYVDADAPLPTR